MSAWNKRTSANHIDKQIIKGSRSKSQDHLYLPQACHDSFSCQLKGTSNRIKRTSKSLDLVPVPYSLGCYPDTLQLVACSQVIAVNLTEVYLQ